MMAAVIITKSELCRFRDLEETRVFACSPFISCTQGRRYYESPNPFQGCDIIIALSVAVLGYRTMCDTQ